MHCTLNNLHCTAQTKLLGTIQVIFIVLLPTAVFSFQQRNNFDLLIPPEGGKISDVATASNNTLYWDLFSLIIFTFLKVEWLRAMDSSVAVVIIDQF